MYIYIFGCKCYLGKIILYRNLIRFRGLNMKRKVIRSILKTLELLFRLESVKNRVRERESWTWNRSQNFHLCGNYWKRLYAALGLSHRQKYMRHCKVSLVSGAAVTLATFRRFNVKKRVTVSYKTLVFLNGTYRYVLESFLYEYLDEEKVLKKYL